jgi:hypothetical protein
MGSNNCSGKQTQGKKEQTLQPVLFVMAENYGEEELKYTVITTKLLLDIMVES